MENKAHDWPIGFAMELSMNETAMEFFAELPKEKKREVIEKSRQVKSKYEMEQLVDSIKNIQ